VCKAVVVFVVVLFVACFPRLLNFMRRNNRGISAFLGSIEEKPALFFGSRFEVTPAADENRLGGWKDDANDRLFMTACSFNH
jgi:hypothetical protein